MEEKQEKKVEEDYSLEAWRKRHREKGPYFVRMHKNEEEPEPPFTSPPTSSVEGAEKGSKGN